MKESPKFSESNAYHQYELVTGLVSYIQRVRGVDCTTYSTYAQTQAGCILGVETTQLHTPQSNGPELSTTCRVITPYIQGDIELEADWLATPSCDSYRYIAHDGQSSLNDAHAVFKQLSFDVWGTAIELSELPYRSLDLATHRHMQTQLPRRSRAGGQTDQHLVLSTSHSAGHAPEETSVKLITPAATHKYIWTTRGCEHTVADSTPAAPREGRIIQSLWNEAFCCMEDETTEGRPLQPWPQLLELCEQNLVSVLARAGELA